MRTDRSISELAGLLGDCSIADAARLRRRLRALETGHGRDRRGPDPREVERLRGEIESARERLARRRAGAPRPTFGQDLPILARREEIERAIEGHPVVVVCGETGSGKSTQLPKICLGLGRGVRGMIGHTQPRRIAARSIAARLAEELGEPLGGAVGFRVRFGDRTSEGTLIKVMTDGILLAETQGIGCSSGTTRSSSTRRRAVAEHRLLLGYLRTLLDRRAT